MISLLGVAASVVSFGASRALQTERFNGSLYTLKERLELAQQLMLTLNTDVEVLLLPSEEGLTCRLEVERLTTQALGRALELSEHLPGLKFAEFVDRRGGSQQGAVHLFFLSGGGYMSEGLLTLTGHGGKRDVIELLGFPVPIEIGARAYTWESVRPSERLSDELFPQEIFE